MLVVTGGSSPDNHLSSTELLDFSMLEGGWREAGVLPLPLQVYNVAMLSAPQNKIISILAEGPIPKAYGSLRIGHDINSIMTLVNT